MGDLQHDIPRLATIAGANWVYALAAACIAVACESAGGKHDEDAPRPSPLLRTIAIVGLVSPFLLILHGFWSATRLHEERIPLLAIASVFVAVSAATGVGMAVGAVVPPLGRLLNRISPVLTVVAVAFTVYVTWPSVLEMIDAG